MILLWTIDGTNKVAEAVADAVKEEGTDDGTDAVKEEGTDDDIANVFVFIETFVLGQFFLVLAILIIKFKF